MEPNSLNPEPSRHFRIASIGGALAAGFLASLCCLGPLLFAILGIGGAGLLVKFEPYRPYFIVLTLGFLGAGFYFTYRKPKPVAVAGPALAEGGDACGCPHPKANRTGKVMLWVATALVLGFLAFPSLSPLLFGGTAARAQTAPESRTVALHIEGMDCPACTTAVRIALRKLDGVREATVSYPKKQAVVDYVPGKVTPAQLAAAVKKLGYEASLPDAAKRSL